MTTKTAGTTPFLDPQVRQFCNDSRLRGHRPATINLRRRILNNAASQLGRPILEASEDELLKWFRRYSDHSQATRVTYGRAMTAFWSWAVTRRLVDDNHATVLPIPRNPIGQPRPMDVDDLARAMTAASPRMRLWLLLAACAGMRAGEVARLRRDDVETRDGAWLLHIREGKGGHPRTVPISAALAGEIAAWKSGPGRMWTVTAATLSKQVGAFLHGLGIDATLHSARHLYATTFYRASGHDLFATMAVLGHSNPSTTRLYSKSDPARSVDALAALDSLLRGSSGEEAA
jgi:integrase